MHLGRWLPLFAACSSLAACGGGGGGSTGGGAGSAGSVPAPPAPTNTSITGLVASQSFANDSVTTTAVFDLTSKTTTSASSAKSTLEVRYDAATKSYTLTTGNRTQSFGTADLQTGAADGETLYRKDSAAYRDYLTLVTTPYSSSTTNQYVGLGYWQRNQVASGRQDTTYDSFIYGLPTASTAVPRTGAAAYSIDVFGFYTVPTKTPKTIQGTGNFSIDFASAAFASTSSVTQYDLISGTDLVGGGIKLTASGKLTTSDGSFGGVLAYESVGNPTVGGTISGRFYGPAAEEIGASFSADGAGGASLAGSFTGRKTGVPTENLTLTNIIATQMIAADSVIFTTGYGASGDRIQFADGYLSAGGILKPSPDGSFTFSGVSSGENLLNWGDSDKVTSSLGGNFNGYRKTVGPKTIDLALYKTGSGNGELALTYASFGVWNENKLGNQQVQMFFTYGLETAAPLLSRRTGSATYRGVSYGSAVSQEQGVRYATTGTSQFDVDFGARSISGNFTIRGTQEGNGATRDFGTFTFTGAIPAQEAPRLFFSQNGQALGTLSARFFGPDAEEIAGKYSGTINPGVTGRGIDLAGIAIAKRGN